MEREEEEEEGGGGVGGEGGMKWGWSASVALSDTHLNDD